MRTRRQKIAAGTGTVFRLICCAFARIHRRCLGTTALATRSQVICDFDLHLPPLFLFFSSSFCSSSCCIARLAGIAPVLVLYLVLACRQAVACLFLFPFLIPHYCIALRRSACYTRPWIPTTSRPIITTNTSRASRDTNRTRSLPTPSPFTIPVVARAAPHVPLWKHTHTFGIGSQPYCSPSNKVFRPWRPPTTVPPLPTLGGRSPSAAAPNCLAASRQLRPYRMALQLMSDPPATPSAATSTLVSLLAPITLANPTYQTCPGLPAIVSM